MTDAIREHLALVDEKVGILGNGNPITNINERLVTDRTTGRLALDYNLVLKPHIHDTAMLRLEVHRNKHNIHTLVAWIDMHPVNGRYKMYSFQTAPLPELNILIEYVQLPPT